MNWRLIEDAAQTGARNMAIDEALMKAQSARDARPVLRFYDWQPSCLSLGRFQKLPTYLPENAPVDWVRRPTGGRAIWHQQAQEITYSVAFSLEILPAEFTSVTESYRWISRGLLEGLQTLGIGAQLSKAHAANPAASTCRARGAENCFLSAAQCDTIVDGRKLIGAAQCRKTFGQRVVVLQHGSILLDLDDAQWQRALGETVAFSWRNRVTTLRGLGFTGTRADAISALCAGMEQSCGARFENDDLTAREMGAAQTLEGEKYNAALWNENGRETAEAAKILQDVA